MPFIRFITLSMLFMLLAALPSQPIDAKSSGINDSPYEPNDTCESAQNISADGISQEHTFQASGDIDWVKFDATAGTRYRIDIIVPSGSRADVLAYWYSECDTDRHTAMMPANRIMLTAIYDGLIYLSFANSNDSVYGEDVTYQLSVRASSNDPTLIVLAGRYKMNDHLQKNIHNVTDQVYRTFQSYGYSDKNIYYLATDPTLVGYDAPASLDNIKYSIIEWAARRVDEGGTLTLYIVNHGSSDKIYLDATQDEILTPEDLDMWLTELEATIPGIKINIIIEGCEAGSFIRGPLSISSPDRVVITSTDEHHAAYPSANGFYFSDIFLTELIQSRSLADSFSEAQQMVSQIYSLQNPWLDANGDREWTRGDLSIATQRSLVYKDGTLSSDDKQPPSIVSVNSSMTVNESRGLIQAEIRDDGQLEDVWATIYPPSYRFEQYGPVELVEEPLQILKLQSMGDDKYFVEYDTFDEAGIYRIVIHAEDDEGLIAHHVTLSLLAEEETNDDVIIPTIDYDCHDTLPTGPGEAADCVAGFIYVDGQPVEGITVQVQNQSGESETVQTKAYPGQENRPFYHFDLAKLDIHTHQTFTVTVQHGAQYQYVDFIAKPGFQQVDVVIPSFSQTRPIATINHPEQPRIDPGNNLIIEGIGHPGILGTKIISYKWDNLTTGAWLGGGSTLELPANYLSPGSHTLSLKVQDSNRNWSRPTVIKVQAAADEEKPWTFLLYLSADFHDDGNLHSKFQNMLDDLDKALGSDNVQIAAQIDGPEDGDTERWLIRNGHSPVVDKAFCDEQSSCEVETDQPDALADFLRWGQTLLPAERYYLAIANHGQAIQGIAWDTTSDLADDGIQNDSAYLTIQELGEALRQPGVQPVDILHLDACSMNLLETSFELQGLTDVLISSQYLAWDYFAYDQYLNAFADLNRTSQEVSAKILEHYAELAEADEYPYTISALDIKNAATVLAAFNQISNRLLELREAGELDEQNLHAVREQVQNFDSHGDQTNDPTDYYIDMLDWSTKLTSTVTDRELKLYAAELTKILVKFIIANSSGSDDLPTQYEVDAFIDLEQANGLSIFYPMNYNSEAYEAYINHEIFSFTAVSSWTDFLSGLGGATASQSGDIEPYPGPLSHLETQSPKLYLPLIMR